MIHRNYIMLGVALFVFCGCAGTNEDANPIAEPITQAEPPTEIGRFIDANTIWVPEGYGVPSGEYVIERDDHEIRATSMLSASPQSSSGLVCVDDSVCTTYSELDCPTSESCQIICYEYDESGTQFPVPIGGGFCQVVYRPTGYHSPMQLLDDPDHVNYTPECACRGY